jgi:hypothetical protein
MLERSTPRHARRPRRWSTFRMGLLALLVVCIAASPTGAGHSGEPPPARGLFRLAFSSSMFTEVNVDDARAAMKTWMLAVARERGIPIDPEPKVYDSLEEMARTLLSGLVEGFAGTAEECWRLSKEVKLDRMVVAINGDRTTEEYVLLVHRDSGIADVRELRGRRLLLLQNPRMSLATVWLDTLLIQKGLEPTARFSGGVTSVNKLSQVVLPVFFRKSDACLVTRRGFETMSELNPQVGKLLRVVAVSPEVVPSGFAFHSDSTSPFRDQMLIEMGRLSDSPAGQQILTLLQADRIEVKPISCMSGAFELLSAHQRLSSSMVKDKGAGPVK